MEWSPRSTQRDNPRRQLQQQPPPPPHHPLAGDGTVAAAATHISRGAQADDGSGGLKRKPPYSYSTLISFAINSSPTKKMTLSDIYTWICANFPFYREAGTGWKVGARQLSLVSVSRPPLRAVVSEKKSAHAQHYPRSKKTIEGRGTGARRFQAPTLAHGMKRFAIAAAFGCLCFFRAAKRARAVPTSSRGRRLAGSRLGVQPQLGVCCARATISPVIVV